MTTTTLIAEIIVIGSFALIWVMLLAFKFFGLDVTMLSTWFLTYKDWSTTILLGLIVVCYQLGWIVNSIGTFLEGKTFGKIILQRLYKEKVKDLERIRTTVQLKASGYFDGRLREDLTVLRLIRAASINFLLIGFGFFLLNYWTIGLISLGVSVICFLNLFNIYDRYYSRILKAYEIITEDERNAEKKTKNTRTKISE